MEDIGIRGDNSRLGALIVYENAETVERTDQNIGVKSIWWR